MTASVTTLRPRISSYMRLPSQLIKWRATGGIVVSFSSSTNVARAIATSYLLPTSTAFPDCIEWDSIRNIAIIVTWIHGYTSTTLDMPLLLVNSFLWKTCHIQCCLTANSTRSSQRVLVQVPAMDYYAWVRAYRWCQRMMTRLLRLDPSFCPWLALRVGDPHVECLLHSPSLLEYYTEHARLHVSIRYVLQAGT